MYRVEYRNATINDLEILVSSRLDFININITEDMDEYDSLKIAIQNYFIDSLKKETCDIVLGEIDTNLVATGIVFYYDSVPSKFNPNGKNAYITSMYVDERFRRQGIASTILGRLLCQAHEKGYNVFILQESEMGRQLYEKFGFIKGNAGMILRYE